METADESATCLRHVVNEVHHFSAVLWNSYSPGFESLILRHSSIQQGTQKDDKLDNVHNGRSRVVVDAMVKATSALATVKTLTEKLRLLITVSTSQVLIEITPSTLYIALKR